MCPVLYVYTAPVECELTLYLFNSAFMSSTIQSIRQNLASPRIVIADSVLTWHYLAITHSLSFANNWLAVWSTINIKSNNKNHSSTQT